MGLMPVITDIAARSSEVRDIDCIEIIELHVVHNPDQAAKIIFAHGCEDSNGKFHASSAVDTAQINLSPKSRPGDAPLFNALFIDSEGNPRWDLTDERLLAILQEHKVLEICNQSVWGHEEVEFCVNDQQVFKKTKPSKKN